MFEMVSILVGIALSLALFGVIFFFARPLYWGAPYAPSDERKIARMLALANLKKNDHVVDIGSGDGKILIELAKRGMNAAGYEINPILFHLSKINIRRKKLERKIVVYKKNFWRVDLSSFDVVIVFGMPRIMGALEKKLQSELRPGSRVVCNHFPFPSWRPNKVDEGVFVYVQ